MPNAASEPVEDKVLDAYALMAFLEDEPGAALVENMLHRALRGEIRLEMTVVNLGEVYYNMARKKSHEEAEAALDVLLGLPVVFVPVDWTLSHLAAQFKANGGIAYADCFAAALAFQHSWALVTGDREFRQLEDFVSIEWI